VQFSVCSHYVLPLRSIYSPQHVTCHLVYASAFFFFFFFHFRASVIPERNCTAGMTYHSNVVNTKVYPKVSGLSR
jgi:hypothetical protein